MNYKEQMQTSIDEIFIGSALSNLDRALQYKDMLYHTDIENCDNYLFIQIRCHKLELLDEIIEDERGLSI